MIITFEDKENLQKKNKIIIIESLRNDGISVSLIFK